MLQAVQEKNEELSMFFTMLKKFNMFKDIDEGLKRKIIAFFEHSWANDKNISV